jgi:hypothetical protein
MRSSFGRCASARSDYSAEVGAGMGYMNKSFLIEAIVICRLEDGTVEQCRDRRGVA